MVGMPNETKQAKPKTGRPAGWHWMAEFVDKDGNVFHKGVEQPKLKGTLPLPRSRSPRKKRSVGVRKRFSWHVKKRRRQLLEKAPEETKDFLNHNFGG